MKTIILLFALTALPFSFANTELESQQLQDDNAICNTQDQSSAENLLKTVIACHNAKRNIDILPLTTTQHIQDAWKSASGEEGNFVLCCRGCGNPFISVLWEDDLTRKDQQTISPIKSAQFNKDDLKIDKISPKISGSLKFSAIQLNSDKEETLEDSIKFVVYEDKYYLSDLPEFLEPVKLENTQFKDDNTICDAQDQSSAENLLKTIIACYNANRSK